MPGNGRFPREDGLLGEVGGGGGSTLQRKRGTANFWGKCLKNVRFTKKHCFSESNAWCNGR